jgi:hypothetical protein
MALRFEDPPPARRNVVDPFAADLEELKQHPNRWAVIATHPRSEESKASAVAQAIRLGKTPACQPKGSFEAKQRRVDEEHRVYVRYVGEQEQPDA